MQEGADADVAPDHVIPAGRVEEGVAAERRVAGVDVAEIRQGDGGQIQTRRRRVPARVACDDRERREQEVHVLQLQREAQGLRREAGCGDVGNLVRVEGERIAHAHEVGVYPGGGVVSVMFAPWPGEMWEQWLLLRSLFSNSQEERLHDSEEEERPGWKTSHLGD